jgi:hypothetical protein
LEGLPFDLFRPLPNGVAEVLLRSHRPTG